MLIQKTSTKERTINVKEKRSGRSTNKMKYPIKKKNRIIRIVMRARFFLFLSAANALRGKGAYSPLAAEEKNQAKYLCTLYKEIRGRFELDPDEPF